MFGMVRNFGEVVLRVIFFLGDLGGCSVVGDGVVCVVFCVLVVGCEFGVLRVG